jgi:hypothetical protein
VAPSGGSAALNRRREGKRTDPSNPFALAAI